MNPGPYRGLSMPEVCHAVVRGHIAKHPGQLYARDVNKASALKADKCKDSAKEIR